MKAFDRKKVSLYKKAEEPVRRLYLRSISYFNLSSWDPSSGLIKFFEELHDSSCDYCKDSDETYIACPWQQNTFRVIGMDRMTILTNDYDLIHRKG
jgi:hypothetical protein